MRIRVAELAVLTSMLAACNQSDAKKDTDQAPTVQESASTRPMLGVYADRFQCDTIVTVADFGAALGGTAVTDDTAGALPPKNVAKSCDYRVTMGAGDAGVEESWSFDFDCRPDYQKRVDLLFAQYTQQSADLVAAYNAQYGTKPPPPNDAGVVQRAPTDAHEVAVGRKGLDHHGQGILFIDDDAPCYVRVVGPGADRRLLIANLVMERLHEANAPMTPHLGKK